jgi:hypothetical protein
LPAPRDLLVTAAVSGASQGYFASYLQRHAKARLKLSRAVSDEHLSDRMKAMADDLMDMKAMADDLMEKAREADDRNPNDWKTGLHARRGRNDICASGMLV